MRRKHGDVAVSSEVMPMIADGDYRSIIEDGNFKFQCTSNDGKTWHDILIVDQYGDMRLHELETSLGSLSIGGVHDIGSGGEKISVKNNVSGNVSLFVAQTVSADGKTVSEAQKVTFGPLETYRPDIMDNGSAPCNTTSIVKAPYMYLSMSVTAREDYKGRAKLMITDNEKEKLLYEVDLTLDTKTDYSITIPLKYLLFLDPDQSVLIEIVKPDGTWLQVRNTMQGLPCLSFSVREWKFEKLVTESEMNAAISTAITGLITKQQLDAAIANCATHDELQSAITKIMEDVAAKYVATDVLSAMFADHAKDKYVDIMSVRIQWGSFTGKADGFVTVKLPAPYANTAYKVVGATKTSKTSTCNFSSTRTTTTFDAGTSDYENAWKAFDADYIAIGEKP